ncbi:hypothetical protein [Nocardioides guangzhouensis]|uniref:hypothetical protein n=1 Tax=Nocardioides guangzhouensis TaxID=2497878 RepID=UPI0014385BAD|nr:hypothetical protein [Nocardioides guangzhouensis]
MNTTTSTSTSTSTSTDSTRLVGHIARVGAVPTSTPAIEPRMNGPRRRANGGFATGTFADLVGGTATVALHRTVPLGRSFAVLETPEGLAVLDGDDVVATVRAATPFVVEPPVRPSYARAEEARRAYPYAGTRHALSDCVVCGTDRTDGLHVTPGPLPGHTGILAAPYDPPAWFAADGLALPASVWGAMDCVSYPASLLASGRIAFLGSLTAHRTRDIAVGEPLVAVGWTIGSGTRSHRTASVLLDEDGRVIASAHAVWVEARRQRLTRLAGRWL